MSFGRADVGQVFSTVVLLRRYTGTEMCGDPVNGVVTILLTNRVYPSSENDKVGIYRRKFNNAVVQALGLAGSGSGPIVVQE